MRPEFELLDIKLLRLMDGRKSYYFNSIKQALNRH